MREGPTVAVIVSAHTEKRWERLQRCIDSLRHQSRAPDEILVVIDHNPALLQTARSGLMGVRVIENFNEGGAAGSRNAGIASSSSSLVAFIDDDAEAAPDWLERLLQAYQDRS